jgi:hypothetical protein
MVTRLVAMHRDRLSPVLQAPVPGAAEKLETSMAVRPSIPLTLGRLRRESIIHGPPLGDQAGYAENRVRGACCWLASCFRMMPARAYAGRQVLLGLG